MSGLVKEFRLLIAKDEAESVAANTKVVKEFRLLRESRTLYYPRSHLSDDG